MISHDRAEQLISERMDAPLAASDQRDLLAHLSGCASCRRFADQIDAMTMGVRALPQLPPSPMVTRTVLERVERGPSGWARMRGAFRIVDSPALAAASAVALVAALGGTIYLATTSGDGDGDPEATISAVALAPEAATSTPEPTSIPAPAPAEEPEPTATAPATATPVPTATPRPRPTRTPVIKATIAAPTATAIPIPEPTQAPVLAMAPEPAPADPAYTGDAPVAGPEPTWEPAVVRETDPAPAEEPAPAAADQPIEVAQEVAPADAPADAAPAEEPVAMAAAEAPLDATEIPATPSPEEGTGETGVEDGSQAVEGVEPTLAPEAAPTIAPIPTATPIPYPPGLDVPTTPDVGPPFILVTPTPTPAPIPPTIAPVEGEPVASEQAGADGQTPDGQPVEAQAEQPMDAQPVEQQPQPVDETGMPIEQAVEAPPAEAQPADGSEIPVEQPIAPAPAEAQPTGDQGIAVQQPAADPAAIEAQQPAAVPATDIGAAIPIGAGSPGVNPAIAPDGSTMVTAPAPDTGAATASWIDPASGAAIPLDPTAEAHTDVPLGWASGMAFFQRLYPDGRVELRAAAPGGGGYPVWSGVDGGVFGSGVGGARLTAGGDRIAFLSGGALYVAPTADPNAAAALPVGNVVGYDWSPDGGQLAVSDGYTVNVFGPYGEGPIFAVGNQGGIPIGDVDWREDGIAVGRWDTGEMVLFPI